MDRELADLRRGYRDEQRRLVPDPDPCPPVDREHEHGPRDNECAECPECGERHATLRTEVETDLDRYCNECLRDALIDRMGRSAVAYVEREVSDR